MKIAFISDLHLENRSPFQVDIVPLICSRNPTLLDVLDFPETLDADVLVIAGDTHSDPIVRAVLIDMLESRYRIPVIHVHGNHCCYHRPIDGLEMRPCLRTIDGVTFGVATLWTHLSKKDISGASSFSDFVHIPGMTTDIWNRMNAEHLEALEAYNPDVIVTHHAPFVQSISKGYEKHPDNGFFINTKIDAGLFPNAKLWIHGHVHQDHDYTIGDLRVVCNPVGYHFENRPTRIKVVEI